MNRCVAVSFVNRSATSGRAFLRALVSILEEVTAFHVVLYSPAWTLSESSIVALMASLIAFASACASSIRAWIHLKLRKTMLENPTER